MDVWRRNFCWNCPPDCVVCYYTTAKVTGSNWVLWTVGSSKIAWSTFLSSVTSWLTSVRPIMIIQARPAGGAAARKGMDFPAHWRKSQDTALLEVEVCARSVSHIISRCHSLRGQRTHGLKLDWCYCCCLTSLTALCALEIIHEYGEWLIT